ncbi:MAG: hypothetical protein RQ847_09020 [Wenzhouxiangellaceae bacterium]|nr:hypothetical protein [Wenzhouxiangellaceae bacterium]
MNAISRYGTLVVLPLVALAAGCAHSPETRDTGLEPEAAEVEFVRVPGSRLLRRADPDNPHATTGASPARIYGDDELESTGRTEIVDALRQLDPAVGGGGR